MISNEGVPLKVSPVGPCGPAGVVGIDTTKDCGAPDALYSVLTPAPQTARAAEDPALVRQGEQVYNNTCISCHGANLQGVQGRGPSLIGVGDAAVLGPGKFPSALSIRSP